MHRPQAMIFDMDGTLVDTAPLWCQAALDLADQVDLTWTDDLAAKANGLNSYDLTSMVHREHGLIGNLTVMQERFRRVLTESFETMPIHPVPGSVSLIHRLAGQAPMAVASGSPMRAIELALDRLEIISHFDLLISSESVSRGKPHPDVFLETARQLGVSPRDCLVFEDSLVGVQAAIAAGMRCYVRPSRPVPQIDHLATKVFDSWDAIDPRKHKPCHGDEI